MNNEYNKRIYLTYNDLNAIENAIESITNEIQERLFNNTSSPLRTIEVGDNLNTKTLYISFPRNMYEYISGNGTDIVTTDKNSQISYEKVDYTTYDDYRIGITIHNNERRIYQKRSDYTNPFISVVETKLPYNVGIVTSIDINNNVYDKIKIYENDDIIPNYVKHTWVENELLSMQKIHNIERGIKNIGRYFYKPTGWIETQEWIHGLGTNTKHISYKDLNRWQNNLSLINFDNLEVLNIWNTDITHLQWNKYYDGEWEEL